MAGLQVTTAVFFSSRTPIWLQVRIRAPTRIMPISCPPSPPRKGRPERASPGRPGFQWITWDIAVSGDIVTINIKKPDASRLLIVQYDKTDTSDGSAGVSTDGNISLFYADFFDSVSTNPAWPSA